MKLKPLDDRVVIEIKEELEEKNVGGIIIPDTAKEKPQIGEIIAVGPGKINDEGKIIPVSVKVGDKILYGKYGGTEVDIEDKKYLIISSSDILAIIK
ncbi:MAG: co-chaperone GroES [Candidatus Cloacimonetes bacterium]|nr:co-chaperone GroES [Candidatus Cloacimonadota bacterium]MBL7148949.1 co-chaperone GroES [Candidatus Cloacimonadota bacterium]